MERSPVEVPLAALVEQAKVAAAAELVPLMEEEPDLAALVAVEVRVAEAARQVAVVESVALVEVKLVEDPVRDPV